MIDPSEEDRGKVISEEQQREILKQEFTTWLQILKEHGIEGETTSSGWELDYSFAIDRENDELSKFTTDEVEIVLLEANETLEGVIFKKGVSSPIKTQEAERWIMIDITPKNPYDSEVGVYTYENYGDYYYTERLNIFLSSMGRAYERTDWWGTDEPSTKRPPVHGLSYLKQTPSLDNPKLLRYDEEPVDREDIEPFGEIQGSTLERLLFLSSSIRSGKVIER